MPEGARFCPACGHSLAVANTEGRRVVTVLFADMVGFTTLAEFRDPEQVKRFVDAAFEGLVADVERFGGRVDKVLGDAIVALFGAPVAHEDDAERGGARRTPDARDAATVHRPATGGRRRQAADRDQHR